MPKRKYSCVDCAHCRVHQKGGNDGYITCAMQMWMMEESMKEAIYGLNSFVSMWKGRDGELPFVDLEMGGRCDEFIWAEE